MTRKEIAEAIAEHHKWFLYQLANAKHAREAGSPNSEAEFITLAAERAAILTALKAML